MPTKKMVCMMCGIVVINVLWFGSRPNPSVPEENIALHIDLTISTPRLSV